ncbi:unnamed protein product, partial [Nesidiocoris tenuis]
TCGNKLEFGRENMANERTGRYMFRSRGTFFHFYPRIPTSTLYGECRFFCCGCWVISADDTTFITLHRQSLVPVLYSIFNRYAASPSSSISLVAILQGRLPPIIENRRTKIETDGIDLRIVGRKVEEYAIKMKKQFDRIHPRG